MALNVGELYASLTLDSKDFNRGVGRAESRFGGTAKAVGGIAAGMVAGIGAALGGAAAAVGGFGVKFNATMEQSGVAWQTLLGGAEEADKMLRDISEFTKSTPFDTENVDMMAKYMHNAGLEGEALFDQLMKNADVASAFAIPAAEAKEFTRQMSQVQQAGVAYTEDLNVLQDRGIPIYKAIADAVGINVAEVKEMASEGKLTSEIYMEAFNNVAKSVEGASEDQAKTLNGMISTLKDNLAILSGEISKPFFNMIKDVMPAIIGFVEDLTAAFQADGIKGALKEIVPPETVDFMMDTFNQIKDAVKSLAPTFEEFKGTSSTAFGTVKEIIKTVVPIVVSLAETWIENFQRIAEIVAPIMETVGEKVMEVISSIVDWWNSNGSELLENVQIVFDGIMTVVDFVMPAVLAIIDMVFNNIKGVVTGALDMISGAFKIFAGLFTGDWSKMWDGVKQLVSGAVKFLWNLWNLMLVGKLVAGVKMLGTKIVSGFKNMWTKAKDLFNSFVTKVQSMAAGFVRRIVDRIKGLWNSIKNTFNTIKSMGSDIWTKFTTMILMKVRRFALKTRDRIKDMKDRIVENFTNIRQRAGEIFSSIREKITGPIKTAKDKVLGWIDDIKKGFSNFTAKIKLPHFSISNASLNPKDWITNGLPKLSVDWYKTGGIATGPAIAGIGEAGSEAIVPLSGQRMKPFADEIAKQMGGSGGGVTINMYGDNHYSSDLDIDYVSEKLGNEVNRQMRMKGRRR